MYKNLRKKIDIKYISIKDDRYQSDIRLNGPYMYEKEKGKSIMIFKYIYRKLIIY